MYRKIIVLCDVDGVLADMIPFCVQTFYELTGITIAREQITNLPIIDCIASLNPDPNYVKKENVRVKIYEKLAAEGTCASLSIFDGAQKTVENLCQDSAVDFRIVTSQLSRSKTWVYERSMWLKKHFSIPVNKIYFAKDKSLVYGDMLIDDLPMNIVNWTEHWNQHHASSIDGLIWNTGYNKDYKIETQNVSRVYNWNELLEKVESLK